MNMEEAKLEPQCPSGLELDRYHYGELGGAREHELTRHIEGCSACSVKLRQRESGFAAFASVDPDRLFSRVRAQIEAEPKQRWWRARPSVLIPAIAACATFLIMSRIQEEGGEDIRTKGALGLSVFRERDGAVEELGSGAAAFRPGDRLRFKVRLPDQSDRSEILIVGVEANGKVSTYYPANGTQRSAAPAVRPDGALAGAIELDAYRGDEWLHLVHCPRRFSLNELEKSAPQAIRVPRECEQTSFLIKRAE